MQYNFTQLDRQPRYHDGILTEFGGIVLDKVFSGFYRTYNVTGRGVIAPAVTFTEKIGSNGVWIDETRIPERYIDVEAHVDAKYYRQSMNYLNRVLHRGMQPLRFSDEGKYYFKALFMDYDNPKEDSDHHIINLQFLCADPYKYSVEEHELSGKISLEIDPYYLWSLHLMTLEIKGNTSNTLTISNTQGQKIKLAGKGNKKLSDYRHITFNFEDYTISGGGVNLLNLLTIDSDFEDFELEAKDKLFIDNTNAEMRLKFRERLL